MATYGVVCELLQSGRIPSSISDIITHRFKLEDYKEAIKVASNKKKYSVIKAIFDYEL